MSEKTISNPLEQYVLLAKTAKGAAMAELIRQVLEAPNVYVFGELLDMPNICELSGGEYSKYLNALNLFAYGTYKEYRKNIDQLPELSDIMLRKLKALTVVSLSLIDKRIPYSTLLEELDMKNTRELEDLIIEIIYANVIEGKLDQRNQRLEVDYSIGRDVTPAAVKDIIQTLEVWCANCENMQTNIEKQIREANTRKAKQSEIQAKVDQEISSIKQTLKATQQVESAEAEQMITDVASVSEKPAKKASKSKIRSSGKLFGKSS